MARVVYNASRALGQVLAEGVDKIIEGTGQISNFHKSFRRMDAQMAESEVGVTDVDAMNTAVQTILKHLEDMELEDNLYDVYQG